MQWSKDRIVARIRQLRAEGAALSYNRVATERQGLLSAASYHFGSWRKAVEAAGIPYEREVRRVPKWTGERITHAIGQAREAGVDLSWTSISKNRDYSGMAYAAIRSSRFGSWDGALRAAGIDPAGVRRYESWSEAKVIQRIKERAQEGRDLNSKAMQQQDCKLFNAALKRYESWEAALKAAHVNPELVYKRRRWDRERIKRDIGALWCNGTDLAAPYMRKHHSALYSAACKYFGSWTDARKACGIRKDFRKRT